MSNSSDPYPRMEKELCITRGAISLMKRYNFPLLLLTKSDIVIRDTDLLENMQAVVAVTITTLDDALAKKLEPFAPLPSKRLRAIELLVARGIKTVVRFDPIIPTINDSEENIREVVDTLASIGIEQIISSTYKAKRDNFTRVIGVFKKNAEKLTEIYYKNGEIVRGIRYAPRELRMGILKKVRDEASKHGIPFSVCREGLTLNTAPTCDASHLLWRNI